MKDTHSTGLNLYRYLLKLYPKTYRDDYEDEMVYTLREMLAGAKNPQAKWQLVARTVKDYALTLPQQNLAAAESSLGSVPYFIKRNFTISTSLIAPFFMIFIYNYATLFIFKRPNIFGGIEAKTWTIYSIGLPLLALLLIIYTLMNDVYRELASRGRRKIWHVVSRDWLPIGVILAVLALVAIF